MNKKGFFLIFVGALVSAFLGGFVSNYLWLSARVVANDGHEQKGPLSGEIQPGSKVIEANQFRLVDPEGNCLAKLAIEEEQKKSALDLLEPSKASKTTKKYHAALELGTGSTTVKITKDGIELKTSSSQTELESNRLTIRDVTNGSKQTDSSGTLTVQEISRPRIAIYAYGGDTAIRISDNKGEPRAVLGSVDLNVMATGEVRRRSESSIVLFGKDGKVVYSAP